ncbi:MAG TPA: hypothetical protein VMB18_11050 [Terriglobales bacterium]|nr:hypothetical protein [Terriglobales bacterium]
MTHRLCLFLLLVSSAAAQLEERSIQRVHSLKVRIALAGGQPCNASVHARLIGISGDVAQAYAGSDCVVDFGSVAAGSYHVSVSVGGVDFPNAANFEVESRNHEEISVSVPSDRFMDNAATGAAPVSVAELAIPANARKEFDAGSALMAKENWKKAAEKLTKAVSIYPRYAEAYNNLAVADARLGSRSEERAALEKSIAANDHFAPAYVNLARMDLIDGNFPDAETLLNRATAINPTEVTTLVLLSNMQLLNQHYEQAIVTARKVHSMTTAPHASAHTAAAHAFEAEGKLREALFELQLFLVEEATGPRADSVREEMSSLLTRMR